MHHSSAASAETRNAQVTVRPAQPIGQRRASAKDKHGEADEAHLGPNRGEGNEGIVGVGVHSEGIGRGGPGGVFSRRAGARKNISPGRGSDARRFLLFLCSDGVPVVGRTVFRLPINQSILMRDTFDERHAATEDRRRPRVDRAASPASPTPSD